MPFPPLNVYHTPDFCDIESIIRQGGYNSFMAATVGDAQKSLLL